MKSESELKEELKSWESILKTAMKDKDQLRFERAWTAVDLLRWVLE